VKVVVIGLGFSGLRAAALLESAGVQVEMYEARGRPGGRMHCVDEGDGVMYEAGGEWIDSEHHRCMALLREYRLEPDPRAHWPQKLVFKGKQTTEHLMWNDALEDDLRVEAAARELCRDLDNPPWENTECEELDHRTLDEFLREHTSSERGLWWVTAKNRSEKGDDPERLGLLGWLAGYVNRTDREGDVVNAHRIPGGSRHLAERMLSRLKGDVQFGAVLTRIRQSGDVVKLVFEDGTAEADKVLITAPPRCLERIVFEPALNVAKRCAVEACETSRAVKIAWHFSHPWWREEEEWDGSMLSDTAIQQTWDSSLGDAAVLTAYVCGEQAVKWGGLGDPVSAGLYELGQIFPAARQQFVRGWYHDWQRDPYSRGAFSHWAPGYVMEHMKYMAPPEGRIFFAGEHTSVWGGYLEGALESAERAVREILGLAGR